jgi:uncharacterized protein DUF1269
LAVPSQFTDVGINDQFMKDVASTLQSGNAALLLLIRKVTADKVLADLKGVGGKVLRTSLDQTKENALREALAGATTAAPKTGTAALIVGAPRQFDILGFLEAGSDGVELDSYQKDHRVDDSRIVKARC